MDTQSDSSIYLIGYMGTGKSTVGALLSQKLNATLVEMDQVIAKQQDMEISDIFDEYGENYFRRLETGLLQELDGKKNLVVSTGGGVVLREENIALMRKNGCVVYLTAKPEVIYERVKDCKDRPLLNENMSVEYIEEMLRDRKEYYRSAAHIKVSTNNKSVEEIVEEICEKLEDYED